MSALDGLQAAWALARGRADGVRLLAAPDGEMAMATRSFWAAPLCLPAFVALHVVGWMESGLGRYPARGFAVDLLGFAVGWLAFAVLSHRLAGRLQRAERWPRFIAAWNWCNVLQYLALVLATLPPLLGLPDAVGETAWLVAMGWALWLEWFAARLTLAVPGIVAAGIVALDVAIGLALVSLSG